MCKRRWRRLCGNIVPGSADIKRAVIAEPVYTSLRDGRQAENSVPQVAAVGTVSIKSGGWEDE